MTPQARLATTITFAIYYDYSGVFRLFILWYHNKVELTQISTLYWFLPEWCRGGRGQAWSRRWPASACPPPDWWAGSGGRMWGPELLETYSLLTRSYITVCMGQVNKFQKLSSFRGRFQSLKDIQISGELPNGVEVGTTHPKNQG